MLTPSALPAVTLPVSAVPFASTLLNPTVSVFLYFAGIVPSRFTPMVSDFPGCRTCECGNPVTWNGGSTVMVLTVVPVVPMLVIVMGWLALTVPAGVLAKLNDGTLIVVLAPVETPVPVNGTTTGCAP